MFKQAALLIPLVAGMTDLKAGPVQVAELYVVLCACLVLASLGYHARRMSTRFTRGFAVWFWLLFAVSCVGSVIAAATFRFAIPSDADTLLKQPGWISASRLVQLLMAYFCFVLVHTYSRRSPKFLRQAVRVYVYSATLFGLYGIASWLLLAYASVDIGGAYGEDGTRLRAFFVEGGPFGMYAASAIVLLFAQRGSGAIPKGAQRASLVVLLAALLLAQSKAAAVAVVATCLVALTLSGTRALRRSWSSVALIVAIAIGGVVSTDLPGQLGQYLNARELLIESAAQYKDDLNVSMGRIAGAVIVPGMIEKHPLLGVGLGNYSLLRDTDEFINGMPAVDAWDLHGLGLAGYVAEIGVLGIFCFVAAFLWVLRAARSRRAGFQLIVCAVFPLTAFSFGTQPTFVYPWILAALALAMISRVAPPPPSLRLRRSRRQQVSFEEQEVALLDLRTRARPSKTSP